MNKYKHRYKMKDGGENDKIYNMPIYPDVIIPGKNYKNTKEFIENQADWARYSAWVNSINKPFVYAPLVYHADGSTLDTNKSNSKTYIDNLKNDKIECAGYDCITNALSNYLPLNRLTVSNKTFAKNPEEYGFKKINGYKKAKPGDLVQYIHGSRFLDLNRQPHHAMIWNGMRWNNNKTAKYPSFNYSNGSAYYDSKGKHFYEPVKGREFYIDKRNNYMNKSYRVNAPFLYGPDENNNYMRIIPQMTNNYKMNNNTWKHFKQDLDFYRYIGTKEDHKKWINDMINYRTLANTNNELLLCGGRKKMPIGGNMFIKNNNGKVVKNFGYNPLLSKIITIGGTFKGGKLNGSGATGRFTPTPRFNNITFNEAFDKAREMKEPYFYYGEKLYNTKKELNPVREYNNRFAGNNKSRLVLKQNDEYQYQRGALQTPITGKEYSVIDSIMRCGGRKKAWIGAAISAVAGIAGSLINKNKQDKAASFAKRQQNIQTNMQTAQSLNQLLNANQDDYNDKLIFKCGGRRKASLGLEQQEALNAGISSIGTISQSLINTPNVNNNLAVVSDFSNRQFKRKGGKYELQPKIGLFIR